MNSAGILSVVYTGEPDEVFEFAHNGQGRTFGRDDECCDIVIWSAVNGRELSRIAGRIWRMDDELWVRNLSIRHELTVSVPELPLEPPLPPRRDDEHDRGPARSIPVGLSYVRGPAGCELLVRQNHSLVPRPTEMAGEQTWHVGSVPERLLPVAAALCEPLLLGGQLPATYAEMAGRTRLNSIKKVRLIVAELCNLYASQAPALQERIVRRLQREQVELQLPAEPTLRAGIWHFQRETAAADESGEVRRRRALALPDYFEVAHLLVRRRLITAADVSRLPRAEPVAHDDRSGPQ